MIEWVSGKTPTSEVNYPNDSYYYYTFVRNTKNVFNYDRTI
jgi:hypothetical protein